MIGIMENGTIVFEFGDKDVGVAQGHRGKDKVLSLFYLEKPGDEFGNDVPIQAERKEIVRMIFKNKEGFNIFLDAVDIIRDHFEDKEL